MKNSYQYIILVFLYLFSCSCEKEKEKEKEYGCYIEHNPDAYVFPIKPGMPEWEQLNSSREIDSVLQIPEDVLQNISTEALIETVLNYPRFGDLYFLDDYQLAFDRLTEHFNGFQELLTRNDAAIYLFNRYKLMYPGCDENNWPSIIEPGRSNSFSFAFIEIVIAQYVILNQFDDDELMTVLEETIHKYEEKNRYNYSVFSKKHTVLIAGRIMYLSNYTPFITEYNTNIHVKEFVDKVMLNSNFKTLDLVYEYAKTFPY